ncbi:uncharacterized protein LOC123713011 [Pieris brassicae]|uniref:uncharacterized protein LOC123713011 n=1 Tax=Pieris brassicae TaxID=7116 RepID=UPI001E660D90|nr:uncharacterized protein LOC123713011 [Pieris brassicae]
MAERKFSTSRILLSVAAFILLSGVAAENECYWCGPLAEQVHRSRRAPPCDAPKAHVTMCDAGFPHCAIVATAPPYVESRYCVKIYQDECYLDFCNTTRTWKMTCPCKGNLCNGQNSDREESSFAQLIATTEKALKRRTKKSIKEPLVRSVQTEDKNAAMVDPDNVNKTITEPGVNENDSDKFIPTFSTSRVTHQENGQAINITGTSEEYTAEEQSKQNIFVVVTTPNTIESTIVKISESKEKHAENLFKTGEKLPTAEALQSEHSDTPSENEEVESTVSDDDVTTTEAPLGTEQPTPRENSASGVYFNIYSLIFLLCAKL